MQHLRLEVNDQVATLWLDWPEKLNVITLEARDEIQGTFDDLEQDESLRLVIVRGSGGKAFSAGGKIQEFLERPPEYFQNIGKNLTAAARCPLPVIAAIEGYCFGAGLELALSCDFRVASDDAVFGQPELAIGAIPGSGGSQRLLRLIGQTRAMEMCMLGRRLDAATAESWGLVNRAVPSTEIDSAVDEIVRTLLAGPPIAQRTIKRLLNKGLDSSLETALEFERHAFTLMCGTDDMREGVTAFTEKRSPRFVGR